ncbi:Hypothetical protein R9X50_00530300 [Acrodontium crateriforme]|uniref:DUF7707 domain-containing protein n=1 Tax=Acrodontium crateriforme TaxID=150365 RepID=A0AAQ3M6W3_9PEZI|nr:Hypothetical protein R9X50_00530300 [Acrodontium crateriforme]
MKSSAATLAVAATLLLSASAQTNGQYQIDPNSVSSGTRSYWCQQQISECPLICLQTPAQSSETITNNCNADTLQYSCVCSNGQAPNVTEYSQTLPYFICTEWGNQCVTNCANGDTSCQSACRQQHQCGALNPTRVNTSTIIQASTTSSLAAGASVGADGTVYNGFAGAASTTTAEGKANSLTRTNFNIHLAALDMGRTFGLLGVLGGLFGGFAVLL